MSHEISLVLDSGSALYWKIDKIYPGKTVFLNYLFVSLPSEMRTVDLVSHIFMTQHVTPANFVRLFRCYRNVIFLNQNQKGF